MNKKIKALILIGSIALFSEFFRLVNSTRINLDNKNLCVKQYKKFLGNLNAYDDKNGKGLLHADAYKECK